MNIKTAPLQKTAGDSLASRVLAYALRRDSDVMLLHAAYAVFAVFTFYMVFRHVPWRDEAGPWLYFRDHPFFPDIIYLTRHEGHPFLWFLCVKVVEATGASFIGMLLLNWLFAVGAIWLLFYRSALPLLARVAVAFAPTLVLELAFNARDYTIAILLCFAAAALYPTARERPVRFSLVLALLASTNLFASIIFVGISSQFLLEQACDFRSSAFSLRPLFGRYLLANAILAFGAFFLVLQVAPIHLAGDPFTDTLSHMPPALSHFDHKGLLLVAGGLLALAFLSRGAGRSRVIGGWPVVILAAVPIYVYYGFTTRHLFMLALGVIYFCWIYLDDFLAGGKFLGVRVPAAGVQLLVTFLVFVATWGTTEVNYDLLRPHHDARNAARAIVTRGFDQPDTLVVATDPFRVMPVLLFLKNVRDDYAPPRFGPSPQAFAQDAYVHFFIEDCPVLSDIKPLILDLAASNPQKTILVIATDPGEETDPFANDPAWRLDLIYRTPVDGSASLLDEAYSVYELRPRGEH